jgi:hypothetical protein
MDYLEFIARTTSHIPDKGQVTVRYYGLYANAHRGKIRKAGQAAAPLLIMEEELRPVPSKGWAAMFPEGLRGRPDGLPSVQRQDEGRRLYHRFRRGR